MLFSFFKGGIKVTKPSENLTLAQAVNLIASDTYAATIQLLREATNNDTRKMIKDKLDYFTFSGTFNKRNANNLVTHSGYICLDFDDVENIDEKFERLTWDQYVTCVFLSPTGKGLKVIVKINPNFHLKSFEFLKIYAADIWNLKVDESGKDVCRACYVSHDPKIYYNEKATLWDVDIEEKPAQKVEIKETIKPINTATESETASQKLEKRNALNRVQIAVDYIVANRIDITGNTYEDRLEVGFALSTIGEDARELYHQAVQFNDAYTREDADYKFNDALKNSRFKTPAKFFKLCNLYEVPTKMPRTLQEKKDELTYMDILGDEGQAEEMTKFGFYEKGGKYHSIDLKGKYQEISNFTMKIIYHVETSDEEAYRLISIKNVYQHHIVIQMNTDDFVSVASFKKIIARKGNFIFKGTDADLCRLQDKLQRDEVTTTLVKQLGYNRKFNFYAFANGFYDCTKKMFVPVDELGIVEHHIITKDGEEIRHNFFIPAMSKMVIDKDDLFSNDKRFLLVNSGKSFGDWSRLFCKVYGGNGQIALAFYLIALFSDIVYKAMDNRFPMLNVYGQKGTGKGTMIESMMKLFGLGQKQIMLGGASTVVGMMRKSGQFSNSMLWMDEYKNNLKTNVIESLKNFYDRIGYERGKKDNSFQTESTRIDSAIIVSGQEMPIVEEALFSRFIMLVTQKPSKAEDAKNNFLTLKDWEEKGLSDITVYLLQFREQVAAEFKQVFSAEQRTLAKTVNNADVDDRFINNYAAVVAIANLLNPSVNMPFAINEFRELCKKTLLEQFYVLKGSDSVGKWWTIVEQLFNTREISEQRHFVIEDGKLFIRVQDVYQLYAEAMQKRKDAGILDEATLRNYLENDPKNFVERKKKFFGGGQRWCMVFKYEGLGIDLIAAENQTELQQKYQAAGLKYEVQENTKQASSVQAHIFAQNPEGDYSTQVDHIKPPF